MQNHLGMANVIVYALNMMTLRVAAMLESEQELMEELKDLSLDVKFARRNNVLGTRIISSQFVKMIF